MRTLARRLKDTLGKTVLFCFQDLRVERAVHLLKTTDHNIERIASMVEYADGVTLRTLQETHAQRRKVCVIVSWRLGAIAVKAAAPPSGLWLRSRSQ
jgi:AraC-like DNA-binding protein